MRRFFGALGFVAVLLAALRPHCRAASERLTFSSHRAIGLVTKFINGGSSLDSEAVEYMKLGCPCPRRMLAFAGHVQSALSQRQIQPLFLCPLGRFSARGGLHGSTYGNGITTILSARYPQGVRGLRVGSARTNWHVSAYSRTYETHALKEAVRQRVAVNRNVHLSQSAGNSNADSEKDAVGNAGGAGAAEGRGADAAAGSVASKAPATGDGSTTICSKNAAYRSMCSKNSAYYNICSKNASIRNDDGSKATETGDAASYYIFVLTYSGSTTIYVSSLRRTTDAGSYYICVLSTTIYVSSRCLRGLCGR